MKRAGYAFQALIFGGICAAWPALAAKLDKDACAALAGELAELAATGIKSEMERGPSWCHANLPPDRLRRVHRVLEIEDQLELRCARGAKPKTVPATPVPGGAPAGQGGPTLDARAIGSPPTAIAVPKVSPAPMKSHNGPIATPGSAAASVAAPHAVAAPAPPSAAVTPPAAAPAVPVVPKAPLAGATTAAPKPQPSGHIDSTGTAAPVTTKALQTGAHQVAGPATTPPQVTHPVNQASVSVPPAAPKAATTAGTLVKTAAPLVTPVVPRQGVAPQTAAGIVSPVATKPVDPASQAARKTNPRRKPASAYVSPDEVTPFSLPGLR